MTNSHKAEKSYLRGNQNTITVLPDSEQTHEPIIPFEFVMRVDVIQVRIKC